MSTTFWYAHDDRRTSEKFVELCKSMGVKGRLQIWDHYWKYRVTVEAEGKEFEALTIAWSKLSTIRQN